MRDCDRKGIYKMFDIKETNNLIKPSKIITDPKLKNQKRFKNQKMVHELKIDPIYFRELELGRKTFEVRKDDRPYRVNDTLLLQSFNREANEYTGSMIFASIVGIFGRNDKEKEYVKEGYIILSIEL